MITILGATSAVPDDLVKLIAQASVNQIQTKRRAEMCAFVVC